MLSLTVYRKLDIRVSNAIHKQRGIICIPRYLARNNKREFRSTLRIVRCLDESTMPFNNLFTDR